MYTLELPDKLVERIAHRAAELVADREAATASPWLDTQGAADYLAAKPSRIHDLVQLGHLHPHRDGRRLLFRREDLDAYVNGEQ